MKELSLHILDIAQNSVAAGASLVAISVLEDTAQNLFSFAITDNGCGMSEELVRAVEDPFVTSRTTRKVGLGIPLLKAAAQAAGGGIRIASTVGEGTRIEADFEYDNIDREPLGDIAGTLVSLITMNENLDFTYEHQRNGKVFTLDTRELRRILGEVPLSEPEVASWLDGYIKEGLAELAHTRES